jgi:hypothetical protein
MLQALLHNKLTKYFNSPYEVEDLLTSVVIGSCAYVSYDTALLPFLRESRDVDGQNLVGALGDVESVAYDFWPNWRPIGCEPSAGPNDSAIQLPPESDGRESEPEAGNRGAQPEVLLTFTRKMQPPALVLVEAKLNSGKSSSPTAVGPVQDQLGRYWLHLRERAKQEGAEAVAIVYVTSGLRFPQPDFEKTQEELKRKGKPAARLFWLSWCHFVAAISQANAPSLPRILADVLYLLVERWGLAGTMREWPKAPVLSGVPWHFPLGWRWPRPATGFPAWGFKIRS